MSRLIIHVEGQTEETFVNEVLAQHLHNFGYSKVSARLLGNARSRSRRGGIKSWDVVCKEITNHLHEDSGSQSTMMVDYYALPNSWPNRASSSALPFIDKAESIEKELHSAVCAEMGKSFDQSRFVPYVIMHEFEALLFSDPITFTKSISKSGLENEFQQIKDSFATPEEINDSPHTAPSKRIMSLIPNYDKILFGNIAILDIGLEKIRQECPLFNNWLAKLENNC